VLCLIYPHLPLGLRLSGKCVYIRQSTHAHGITITHIYYNICMSDLIIIIIIAILDFTYLKNATGHRVCPYDSDHGCDFIEQSWCLDIPRVHFPSFWYVATTFIIASFCASSLLCQTIFSKVLGLWPQVWLFCTYSIKAQVLLLN